MAVIDDTWNWRLLSTPVAPAPRTRSALSYAGPGKVLLFGGAILTPGADQANDTWILDSADDQWVQQSPDTVPTKRQEHDLTCLDGKVYMVGGINGAISYFDETLAYDLAGGDWESVPSAVSSPFTNDGSLNYPQGRSYDGVILTNDGTDLICIAPTTNGAGKGNSVWRKTLAGDWAWDSLAAELQNYTSVPGGVYAGDRLVMFGGVVGNVTTALFDLVSTSWARRLAAETYPRRCFHRAVWTGDQMFFYGGEVFPIGGGTPVALADQYVYDPVTFTATELNTAVWPGQVSRYAMAWDGNRVVLFSGTATPTSGSFLSETWVLEPPEPPIEVTPTFHRIGGITIQLDDNGIEGPVTVRTTDAWQES